MRRTKKNNPVFKVLAFDPSLTAFGFAVLQGNTILESGCIKTQPSGKKSRIRKGDDRMRRVSEINHMLIHLITKHNIGYIVSELPHGSQSAVAATALGMVSALVQAIADCFDIGLEWFSEADAKKCALGKKSAAKEEMIAEMDLHYDVDWTNTKYIDEAVADSLAIHYVARKFSHVLKAMK